MGGTNEATVTGLRMHVNNGDVHVHDDNNELKFYTNKKSFKSEVEKGLKQLDKRDGLLKIEGKSSNNLYILRDGKSTHAFVSGKSMKRELKSFLRDI